MTKLKLTNNKGGNMVIQVLKKNKHWYWRIVAKNGKILATSETYSSRSKATKTVMLIVNNHTWSIESVYADKR